MQPLVALGKGLQAAGHTVTLAAGSNFRGWIESHGLTYGPIALDTRDIMHGESGLMMAQSQSKLGKMTDAMRRIMETPQDAVIEALLTHTQRADVVLTAS